VGSTLASARNTQSSSTHVGRDLQVRASTVRNEQGQLQASAAGQVNIEAGQMRQQLDQTHYSRKSGSLSAGSVTVQAGARPARSGQPCGEQPGHQCRQLVMSERFPQARLQIRTNNILCQSPLLLTKK
jgi:hypothetical protein